MTLEAARFEYFRAAEQEGSVCPCCDRFGKKHRRKLNSGMCLNLFHLYQNHHKWVHVPGTANRAAMANGEVSKLRYWELAEIKWNEDDSKKTSGIWRITDKGIAFVEGRIQVPTYAIVYNSVVERFDGPMCTISEALGEPFDYRELMAERTG